MPTPNLAPMTSPSSSSVSETKEVVLGLNANLPQQVDIELDPLIIKLMIPVEFFADAVKQA